MAYYVDCGEGAFVECETIGHAKEIAHLALESARDFRNRMGWTPFWGKCVEIRKGKAGLLIGKYSLTSEGKNQHIVSNSKTHDVLYLKD